VQTALSLLAVALSPNIPPPSLAPARTYEYKEHLPLKSTQDYVIFQELGAAQIYTPNYVFSYIRINLSPVDDLWNFFIDRREYDNLYKFSASYRCGNSATGENVNTFGTYQLSLKRSGSIVKTCVFSKQKMCEFGDELLASKQMGDVAIVDKSIKAIVFFLGCPGAVPTAM